MLRHIMIVAAAIGFFIAAPSVQAGGHHGGRGHSNVSISYSNGAGYYGRSGYNYNRGYYNRGYYNRGYYDYSRERRYNPDRRGFRYQPYYRNDYRSGYYRNSYYRPHRRHRGHRGRY